jgi:hypothetical protein
VFSGTLENIPWFLEPRVHFCVDVIYTLVFGNVLFMEYNFERNKEGEIFI